MLSFCLRALKCNSGRLFQTLLFAILFCVCPLIAQALPSYVVTTAADATSGTASDCTDQSQPGATRDAACSLRDALAASAASSGGNITFDATVFAAGQSASARTITLGSAGTLNIPSGTSIAGLTSGSGATLSNLVTVDGAGSYTVFMTSSDVTGAAISALNIANGSGENGADINSSGTLTITDCTISGGSTGAGNGPAGGGIANAGTMTLIGSAVVGNFTGGVITNPSFPYGTSGGGIFNTATMTIINSIIANNSVTGPGNGGGINNAGTLNMTGSTVTGNTVDGSSNDVGAGIVGGVTTGFNNLITGNTITGSGTEDDCEFGSCGTNGTDGNVIGVAVPLAPLGSYGGPTPSAPPLPGSAALCAGLVADIPTGITTDQRGFPRTTTYGGTPCVDAGAAQTSYSLAFSTNPPATVAASVGFTAAIQLSDHGSPFPVNGISIPIALAAGDNGALNVSTLTTGTNGIAASGSLQVSAAGGGDMLIATLPLTTTPPPASLTAPLSVTATSTPFDVTPSTTIQVTVSASPAGAQFTVDGTTYTAPVTLTWVVGSQHTLAATSPQTSGGAQYTFASWSDGGALSHTVTASASTTQYTAAFTAAYLLTISANPSYGGTVTPASGAYYAANAVVNITETPNSGYTFTGWTGSVASPSSASTTVAMTGPESVTANFETTHTYVVTVNTDDATGAASNCTNQSAPGATRDASCGLRDALAAAAASSGGNISFDATVFAASQPASARTINTGPGGSLNLSADTILTGPVTGSGSTLAQLVIIDGNNAASGVAQSIFTVNSGVTATISGLILTDGNSSNSTGGGGIYNQGTLTVANCLITGNTANGNGAGVDNEGTLTLTGTSITGNQSVNMGDVVPIGNGGLFNDTNATATILDSNISSNTSDPFSQNGGGIENNGTLTLIDSIVNGNDIPYSPPDNPNFSQTPEGGGIYNQGTLTVRDSTIAQNSDHENTTGGIYNQGSMVITNSIIGDNSSSVTDADCGGNNCPANGTDGNVVGPGASSTTPGSAALCAGIVADIPSGITTDQRGLPRTTTYATSGGGVTCVDAGAIQSNYSLTFSTEPPSTVSPNASFTAALQLSESGSPYAVQGVAIPIALGAGDNGTLTPSSLTTAATGIASSSSLQVSAPGTGDTLVAALPITTTPPPASLTAPISLSAASTPFSVSASSQTITFPALPATAAFGAAPIALAATASSGLPITYSVTGPASISGSTLVLTGAGTVVVTASQSGNGSYSPATPVAQTITVTQAATTTTLTSSSPSAGVGASITFTAMVASTTGTVPTGSVQFLDGSSVLGSVSLNAQGSAAYTTTSLAAGTHTIHAVYSGDANFSGSTGSVTQQITAAVTPSFTLTASPSTLNLAAGQNAQSTITLTPSGGYSGTVTFSCTGVPQDSLCTFSPTTLTANGSNTPLTTTFIIATLGHNHGTVSLLHSGPGGSATGMLYGLLPGSLLALLLGWQRKRLSASTRRVLWMLVLAIVASGGIACGVPMSTPPGTSTVTIKAAASGGASQSITITVNISK
ncbi:beta strand repeat-containing protein [Paracidobacterium acidisoli]|uniref:Ig-like domain repeat protein n=1 Tax=Paracidobacterium acidisoli TaxID=2303751 RepID=A0A372IS03_9BACT|nr:Ig-like domain repeat protein [Paracidobacterium acidisoli]MBT9330157.1 Ig-like domain repeat protein [Paracidobacterium acidisoli]